MVKNVEVVEFEDSGVQDLINKTAKELHEKYNKQRKINEKFLKKKTPLKKAFSIFFDCLCVVFLLFGFIVCFSIINTTINGYMPNFFGYSNLVVATKSMVASGYNVGDIVVIHSVDTDTLNKDDKIAFYLYWPSSDEFDQNNVQQITEKSKTKYTLSFKQLFGFQSKEFEKAEKADCDIIFHHIRAIYEEENGERWFKTYGSSNVTESDPGNDEWWVHEDYVIGVEDQSSFSKFITGLIDFVSKPKGMLFISIPACVLILMLILSFLKNVQIAKLELDCVEEKRKITDEICVKNNVGYQMSTKTKFKILAQATDENKEEYISLLWKKGRVPRSVSRYYQRKKLLLNTNQDLLKLNRECEIMFKEGVKPTKIAKYYLTEKEKIAKRVESIQKRLKSIDKYKKNNIIQNNKKIKSKK